ncbi:helix-turn-helix domain-containing protein [Clostridium sp.]|jgi:transcriptional regulator with XRE-family HTH domain|uniref:helix-turn-helix domain-containing protein n=1 Tax=Clostridia TaxID=186801 RepID=UPI00257A9BB4|nr:helix-turn-helix transcriptional regulator [Clostridium sp.]MBS4843195.1 helix-turn-helix transcriptional regulator [Clostridium sp.]MDU4928311.1 helix-turn-helix transcriptional regulator [Clostridium sp.]
MEWKSVKDEITAIDNSEKKVSKFITELVGILTMRRIELGITQSELAELSGIKQSAIARLEALRAVPKLDTIYKLLDPLDLTFNLVPLEEKK